MDITYIDTKNYTAKALEALFQSVGWLSANYLDELLAHLMFVSKKIVTA